MIAGGIQQILLDIVYVDLHPPRPKRVRIASHLPDADIDKSALRPFPPHLIAEEFRAWSDADGKIERQRFPRLRGFRVKRPVVLVLQAVKNTHHWLLDDDPHRDLALIFPYHGQIYSLIGGSLNQSKASDIYDAT